MLLNERTSKLNLLKIKTERDEAVKVALSCELYPRLLKP